MKGWFMKEHKPLISHIPYSSPVLGASSLHISLYNIKEINSI